MIGTANTRLFTGFTDIYNANRPVFPETAVRILINYAGRRPRTVVDLGCGTGLSTAAWAAFCGHVIGVEPNSDMLRAAKNFTSGSSVEFVSAPAEETGLDAGIADIIVCSQSFHWMQPEKTLAEAGRLLAEGGVFAAVDYDWPVIASWQAEAAYEDLIRVTEKIAEDNPHFIQGVTEYSKSEHLPNMKRSGVFRYCREIVFAGTEMYTAGRYVNMALSQSGVQAALRTESSELKEKIAILKDAAEHYFGNSGKETFICYRIRAGVK